jgi:stress response protein SCP2
MSDARPAPHVLRKGANVALSELDAGLGGLTVFLDARGRHGELVDVDVSVLLLGSDGLVRSSEDLIFYNQPIGAAGAVHLRDKIRPEPDASEEDAWTSDVVTLELDDVPEDVERILVSASLDVSTGLTFGDVAAIRLRVQRTDDASDLVVYDIDDASAELALLFGELYRRQGEWKIRAIGQGYADGLPALVTAHGVEVTSEDAGTKSDPGASTVDVAAAEPTGVIAVVDDHMTAAQSPLVNDGAAEGSATRTSSAPKRGVSVRRPTRAPRFPTDWESSIPAADGNDWQTARLFPVAGIGNGEEQERRATSALLATIRVVREFGGALVAKCGGPRGAVATFIEVPFGQDEEAYRPDGVIRVTRGQRVWTALVEVKTASGRLDPEQIDHYVDIARSRGFDAVITISNELLGGDTDHPVAVDRRKLRRVALHHISWDQVRAEALLTARHRGVADRTQADVLEEFIRYMGHARSGMNGLGDMGSSWVKVRDGVKARTARPGDKGTGEVSARFDELIQHLGHYLTGILGVDVRPLPPREAPDHASRRQQLADSGLLFGRLRVPGAVDCIVLSADLRTDKVTAAITVPAPRGETRPLTRVTWLLRQLPAEATDAIRIEAQPAGPRAASVAALLGKAREDPTCLLPADQREIRSFTIYLVESLGPKRASGPGTLIGSLTTLTTTFYADVVQHLRLWTDKQAD